MLELMRQRRWLGFTAFILVMLVLCVFLARWQWNRYQVRLAENERQEAALSAPAVDVAELLDARPGGSPPSALPPELQWHNAQATGVFDTDGERAVRRRPLDGRNGFWILTPLVTESGVLLVNRGWTPAGSDATAAPDVPPAPSGQVTVTGRLRPAEPTDVADEPPVGQAWAADPDELITPTTTERYDNAYLELRSSAPAADADLTMLADPGRRGLNNLVYSVQWVLFGLVGLVGWWRLVQVEARRDDEDPLEATPAQDSIA